MCAFFRIHKFIPCLGLDGLFFGGLRYGCASVVFVSVDSSN
jgi:hypothetical protein